MNKYTKISDTELEVVKDAVVPEPTTTKYSIDFLKSQELAILKQMNDYVEARQKELVEIREFLAKAEEFGLKTAAEVWAEQIVI